MNILPIDDNSRPVPALSIGYGEVFGIGTVEEDLGGQIVRFKAIGDTTFRLASTPSSVIPINDGETEYFFVPPTESVVIISGSLNIMW